MPHVAARLSFALQRMVEGVGSDCRQRPRRCVGQVTSASAMPLPMGARVRPLPLRATLAGAVCCSLPPSLPQLPLRVRGMMGLEALLRSRALLFDRMRPARPARLLLPTVADAAASAIAAMLATAVPLLPFTEASASGTALGIDWER